MLQPVLLLILADGLLALMDAMIKLVSMRYSIMQITWLRFAFGLVAAASVVIVMRPGWPSRETILFNSTRSLLVVVVATSFFYALSVLPLAEAIALSFLSPLFIVLFGVSLLGERLERRTGVALATGFAGMLMIASGRAGSVGYSAEAWLGAAAAVVSALAYGLTIVLLRARATRDPLPTIVLFQNLGPTLLLAIPAAYAWAPLTASDVGLFALIGVVGVGGHLLLALAFAGAEAARLAPITYVSLAWGTLFGYLFFSELPGLMALGGAALIVVGTLATQRR